MSAQLCSIIPDVFCNADDRKKFFSEKEDRERIKPKESRELPRFGKPGESCKTNLFFGFFFDGTKNNYALSDRNKNYTHSNVSRLYDCYPGLSVSGVLPKETDWTYNANQYRHFFRVYVPGVGSPCKEVKDPGTGRQLMQGAAAGWGGQARIVWALIQAINNVHRFFLNTPLIDNAEASELATLFELDSYQLRSMTNAAGHGSGSKPAKACSEFKKLLQRLHANVSQHWVDKKTGRPKKIDPGIVQTIHISVFGFSRGATQARAFTNWLRALCELDAQMCHSQASMTLGGFEVEFDFLGLFDTVASIGLANSFGDQAGAGGLDGHGSWADAEASLRIPQNLKCLHLVAAHEVRRSFPLDSISVNGQLPSNQADEIVFPGMHSDVGGGYMPAEQGKGLEKTGMDMLSRLPLIYMYKSARLAGVPLKLEFASTMAKEKFRIAPETIRDFNNYLAQCKVRSGTLTAIMREQRELYIRWRMLRRANGATPLEKTASFLRASQFDRNDLESANHEFEQELAAFERWRADKGKLFTPRSQSPGFNEEHHREWEEIATWWTKQVRLSDAIIRMFDDYVHDSRAWFKLSTEPDNEADLRMRLDEWVKKLRSARQRNAEIDKGADKEDAFYKSRGMPDKAVRKKVGDGLTLEERRLAEEYERTGQIPRMRTVGREPFSATLRNAKAGYLRFRKVYAGSDNLIISSVPFDKVPKLALA